MSEEEHKEKQKAIDDIFDACQRRKEYIQRELDKIQTNSEEYLDRIRNEFQILEYTNNEEIDKFIRVHNHLINLAIYIGDENHIKPYQVLTKDTIIHLLHHILSDENKSIP